MDDVDENFEFSSDNAHIWPFTPPVEVIRDLQERDPNLFYRMDIGDLINTAEDAITRLAAVESILVGALGSQDVRAAANRALRTVRHG